MQFVDSISEKLSDKIHNSLPEMTQKKQDAIRYGMYILIADVIKNTITFTGAYLLGIFGYCVVALAMMGVLRIFVGGVHAKTWLGCLISNTLILYGISYSSLLLGNYFNWYYKLVVAMICGVIIFIYAPSDHENKPIVSKKQRRKLRRLGFVILGAQTALGLLLPITILSNIVFVSMIVNFVSMLPITYKLTNNKHGDAYFKDVDSCKGLT